MATIILLNGTDYISVQGAGADRYNGIYEKNPATLQNTTVGSDTIQSYRYVKQGDTETLAPLVYDTGGGNYVIEWFILDTPSGPNAYYTSAISIADPEATTKINQLFIAFDSLDNPPPTAVAYIPGPVPGRTWAEHLRLRLLGYI